LLSITQRFFHIPSQHIYRADERNVRNVLKLVIASLVSGGEH
jgi:hypothetical protein